MSEEVKKRMENIRRKKRKTLPSSNLQIIEYLVNEELFLKHVMNVESIGKQMVDIHITSNHQLRNCENNNNNLNLVNSPSSNIENNIMMMEEQVKIDMADSVIEHSCSATDEAYFLNIWIGVSQLEYPCKKLITNTLFRGNLIGVNHPFIIIGPYKIDWNDSSFVKLKCDMFRAASAVMCYQYHTIRGRENVKNAITTIATVCTYWNSYKQFAKLSCNCHHFIKYLLKELSIEDDFTQTHPTLVYILDRMKLVKHERIIPWKFQSDNGARMDFIKTVKDNGIVVSCTPNQEYLEFIVNNLNQLKLLHNLFDSHKKSTTFETEELEHVNEIDCCIDSYLRGYQLRNQTMKPLDYSQINQFTSQSQQLEYPLLNGFFDW
ncbi:predicted protein [Naegleria gruberi]|uniref:Predicted protein n=1 Tax=Naegleria gruberi TaxID=5762 RepID=D2V7L3_NAEGR|nr:uncharacterized protein NAEGRDRAFT_64844 [Naegleria gruberi]EFC47401.1 predicted protein [Naegleria gruberi]|eukprot:XP_002680145.1 predicted protein [Naegleria gruberi strain NEG-M]